MTYHDDDDSDPAGGLWRPADLGPGAAGARRGRRANACGPWQLRLGPAGPARAAAGERVTNTAAYWFKFKLCRPALRRRAESGHGSHGLRADRYGLRAGPVA